MDLQGGGGGIFVAICSSEGLVTLDAIPPPPHFPLPQLKLPFLIGLDLLALPQP